MIEFPPFKFFNTAKPKSFYLDLKLASKISILPPLMRRPPLESLFQICVSEQRAKDDAIHGHLPPLCSTVADLRNPTLFVLSDLSLETHTSTRTSRHFCDCDTAKVKMPLEP